MEDKIRCVTSINQQGTKSFEVGFDGVTEIKDNGAEYEDHVYNQFDAYDKDGGLIATFINGALAIDYFKERL